MKTLREILFARHQNTAPKLDAIRHEVVNAEFHGRDFAAVILNWPITFWRELILPSRRIWAGLATVWILIFAVNYSTRDHSSATTTKMVAPEMMSFGEQQRLLNELLADRSLPVDIQRPKTFSPKPRTETAKFLTA